MQFSTIGLEGHADLDAFDCSAQVPPKCYLSTCVESKDFALEGTTSFDLVRKIMACPPPLFACLVAAAPLTASCARLMDAQPKAISGTISCAMGVSGGAPGVITSGLGVCKRCLVRDVAR